MKRWSSKWFLFAVVVLAACENYPRESERIVAAFEQAQLVYGEGENDTVLFIPELDEAPAYYARKKDYGKAALAALYHGYAEKDYDHTTAMTAFKEAEQYGELVHDSLTVARAQYQMGKMLCYDGMEKDAIVMFRSSEGNFGRDYFGQVLVLNAGACSYILLGDYAKAEICLNKSFSLAEQDLSDETRSKVLNNYAKLYQLQGAYDKAIDYLRMAKPTNNQQMTLNLLNIGSVFMATGEMDSTAYYFGQMENLLSETDIKDETKASAYASLTQFAELQGDYAKALEYQKNNKRYILRVKDRIEKDGVYRIQQQYNYESLRNEMNEKILVRQRIILIMSLVIVLVCLSLVVLKERLTETRKQEMEAKERTLFYIRQYTELLAKQGKTMQKLAIVMENKEDKALLDNLRATVFDKKDPWDALVEVFDTLHPDERNHICLQYPELTEIEFKDIILSYFDVSRQDEALMLKTSVHSIDKIRTSVKKKTQEATEKACKSS